MQHFEQGFNCLRLSGYLCVVEHLLGNRFRKTAEIKDVIEPSFSSHLAISDNSFTTLFCAEFTGPIARYLRVRCKDDTATAHPWGYRYNNFAIFYSIVGK